MRNTLKIIILLMFICCMAFLFCGHIDYYTEEALGEIDGEYLGTAQVETAKDTVKFTLSDEISFEIAQSLVSGVDIEQAGAMPVNLYADLAEINAPEEKRTIITGRLKTESDTIFYRIIRVKCVPVTDSNVAVTPKIDHAMIKWQEDRK